jgi:hypothetical protein
MNIDNILAAPEIVRRLISQDAFENETVTFTCTVQNPDDTDEDEPYSIAWFFNDKQIDPNNEKYSIDENPKTGICLLTIQHITSEDEGAYRCVATSKFGSSVTTGFLAVLSEYLVCFLNGINLQKIFFLGRKRSQSPSPSRNASPNRSLSPSNNRMRDRSASPLRYINLPISKLARVTEELESLINPSASILHEEEKEVGLNKKTEEEVPASDQQKEPSTTETEDSIHLPQVSTSIISGEEVPASTQQKELPITKTVEPEESIILPQVATLITKAPKAENTLDIITTEVSHRLVFFKSSLSIG